MKTRTKVAGLVASAAIVIAGLGTSFYSGGKADELRLDPTIIRYDELRADLRTPVVRSGLYTGENTGEEKNRLQLVEAEYDTLAQNESFKSKKEEIKKYENLMLGGFSGMLIGAISCMTFIGNYVSVRDSRRRDESWEEGRDEREEDSDAYRTP